MILSDKTIKERLKTGEIVITPFKEEFLQPASYDLHLGRSILVFNTEKHNMIDIKKPVEDLMLRKELKEDEEYIINPGDFLLANIEEVTGVNGRHVGRLEGKSSLGRLGLIIHATAGFLDPGNSLKMTLEIANLSPLPIKLYAGMKIAQMAFEQIDQFVEKEYGHKSLNSKYFGDTDVKASQMFKNF
ncbi:MAG TPA: dCTP deaminase [Candidatus Dojkabacteria bacterium]|nr:dCTP deaminase [Candidatus Dojkabacteria bacterium]